MDLRTTLVNSDREDAKCRRGIEDDVTVVSTEKATVRKVGRNEKEKVLMIDGVEIAKEENLEEAEGPRRSRRNQFGEGRRNPGTVFFGNMS